ncbi:hypothetical protein Glove_301g41 [Diversispora epigaea]|uniref:Endonuclease/exonuclease/phosphatase domain-containing protein n=1 Tax=Diversispora epigaea TaxID=1348612 RepID=A0A397HW05_9GLOM|nr:hypothetical protein Glove_301g41 [Diversispora epigaea]
MQNDTEYIGRKKSIKKYNNNIIFIKYSPSFNENIKQKPINNHNLRSNTIYLSRKYKESNKGGYGPKLNKNLETNLQPSEADLDIDIDDLFEIPSVEVFLELTNNLTDESSTKQKQWWEYCIKKKFDIVLLTETRLKEKRAKFTFLKEKLKAKEKDALYYDCFWASNENGAREQGVGFMIQHDLAKHIYKIDKFQDRAISFNIAKQKQWWEYCIKKKFDIVLLTETRLKEKRAKFTFLKEKLKAKEKDALYYDCFWASNENGAREQGVGFMIQHDLAKHIYKIDKFQDRAISLYFSFRGKIIMCIINVYEYANKMDHIKKGKNLTKWIENQIIEAQRKNYIFFVMGDFNGVVNPKLDRINSTLKRIETKLLEMLTYRDYQDYTCTQNYFGAPKLQFWGKKSK